MQISRTFMLAALLVFGSAGVASAQDAKTPSKIPAFVGSGAPSQTVPTPNTPPDQTPRERLEFLLSGYHYFPTKEHLAEVGTDEEVTRMLRDIAETSDLRVSMRVRAIDALGYFGDEATTGYLTHVMQRKPDDFDEKDRRMVKSMKHHAIMSIAKAMGEGSIEPLDYALKHADPQIRMSAISAIGKHAGAAGKTRLAPMLKVEKSAYVKKELRKYVKE